MKLRMHTLAVLIKKDFRLMFTNKNMLIMILLPIGFAVLYQTIFGDVKEAGMPRNFVLTLCELLNLSAIPLTGLAMMVAEEKEKIREKNEVLIIKSVMASIALGEAAATALKNGHANGETEAALEYARKIKHEQKDLLTEQGIKGIYE